MSETLERIRELVARREVLISDHGCDELTDDEILVDDILAGPIDAFVVEDYPTYHKGPCVLVLQWDGQGKPIHVVWWIPKKAPFPGRGDWLPTGFGSLRCRLLQQVGRTLCHRCT